MKTAGCLKVWKVNTIFKKSWMLYHEINDYRWFNISNIFFVFKVQKNINWFYNHKCPCMCVNPCVFFNYMKSLTCEIVFRSNVLALCFNQISWSYHNYISSSFLWLSGWAGISSKWPKSADYKSIVFSLMKRTSCLYHFCIERQFHHAYSFGAWFWFISLADG